MKDNYTSEPKPDYKDKDAYIVEYIYSNTASWTTKDKESSNVNTHDTKY